MLWLIALITLIFLWFRKHKESTQHRVSGNVARRHTLECRAQKLIDSLPVEMWCNVFDHLTNANMMHLQLTCKSFFDFGWKCRKTLSFEGKSRDTHVVPALYNCTNGLLHTISLARCQLITPGVLQKIAAYTPSITSLNLAGCHKISSSEDGFTCINSLTNLRILKLADCLTSDEALKSISKLKFLRTLDLFNNNNITDEGVKALSSLKNLRRLCLAMCFGISNYSLQLISTSLLNLDFLDVVYCRRISDEGLVNLFNLSKLSRLRIYGHYDQITDRGLALIGGVHSLRRLEIPGLSVITSAGIKSFMGLSNLRYLSMERANIEDSAMEFLGNLPNLRTLLIPKCQNITSSGIWYLRKSPLETLSVSNCRLDDNAVDFLKEGPLREIYFANSFITDSSIQKLRENRFITKLSLASCSLITSAGILILQLPNLKHLNLSFNEQILDFGFQNIAENCPKLQELFLSKCKKFLTQDYIT